MLQVGVRTVFAIGVLMVAFGRGGRAGAQSLPGSPSAPGESVQTSPPASPGTKPPDPQTPAPGPDGAAAPSTVAPAGTAPNAAKQAQQVEQASALASSVSAAQWSLAQWQGLRVNHIRLEGVPYDADDTLPQQLSVKEGQPLQARQIADSIRRLFASGRYRDISVEGVREADGVTLVFVGTPRYFVGRVTIEGVSTERLSSLLEYATQLQPGTAFSEGQIAAGTEGIRQSLASSGYFQPTITPMTSLDEPNSQVNVTYTIAIGPQARVGELALTGADPGLTEKEFRKKGKLKRGTKVNRQTVSSALAHLRAQYQKKDRLEATATLEKQTYNAPRKQLDYRFNASQGPLVKVSVEGVKLSKSRIKLLVPIYEEGTIDNDLLNEGTFNIKDYLFRSGYFDATVSVKVIGEDTPSEHVVYAVDRGVKHKVNSVTIRGNHYFDSELLKERMQVQKSDPLIRSGRYSPQLMKSDEQSLQALYRANGFSKTTITSATKDVDNDPSGKPLKVAQIDVIVTIDEGPQQKFGTVTLTGVDPAREAAIKALLSAQEGQPFSLITLSGDRDAVLGYYVSHGFDQARTEIHQQIETADPTRTDVTLSVIEGQQVFVDRVLLSGIKHTRAKMVQDQIQVHPGDPLDQSALLDTQRRLYDLALFNEVVSTIQNPEGDAPRKNVLLQLTEARRWDVTYGFGFEAETGTPKTGVINPASAILLGISPSANYGQNGRTGVSPRASLDVSRINLRGTDESLTLHTTYGLLEEVAQLTFQNPRFFGRRNLSNSISGGYSNVQNITTFQASTLQGDFRITQKYKRTDTFIYNFQYRRVAVNPNTLQVSANLIPLLSQPVRVGGPGFTWFHDKRQPSPLDATKGTYTSLQEFFASSKFGSQVGFSRTDVTNSSYYSWGGKHLYTLARNTRFGVETPFGANPNSNSQSCNLGNLLQTNASCNAVPLPERLYAGGATSHRGFGINDAGPRDLQTGYPVGGNAVLINSIELRLPPPVLPIVGDSVSFVVFHDMGNVFAHVSDMFPSIGRFHQPDRDTCAYVGPPQVNTSYPFGTCNFNYFSHALGLGARYKTPVGPIRVDFSYNLNPPVYPVIYDFNGNKPYEGQAGHFNFFFSIGQAF
ncbi:MAG: BamA/TamA family outer membrane protein [Acidobacteriota bacterium]|nr:BamA/TamA family outer membrane protein [Acidobacteriota bacterium]